MRVTAVFNQKGGSCKTTTTVNLAAALGERRRRVLVIDLDPQQSATLWFGASTDGRGLLDVFTGRATLAALVVPTPVAGVELIPGVDQAMAGDAGSELILRRAIAKLPGAYDDVLIDCPPSLGFQAIAALVAADDVLVPVAGAMALDGLAKLVETIDLVRARWNRGLTIAAILACRVDSRTNLSGEVLARLRATFGARVLTTIIRASVRLEEAPSHQQPITTYAPTSAGAEDYRAAAGELVRRWQKGSRS